MGRHRREGRNLKRDEAQLEAEVLAAVRRFVRKQKRKGNRVQYLNILWDAGRYPYLATEYGHWNAAPIVLPPVQAPDNDVEATSGVFPVAPASPATTINQIQSTAYDWFILRV